VTELDIDKHLSAARRELRVHAWSAPRVEAAFRELGLRRLKDHVRGRRMTRVAGVALAAAVMVLLGLGLWTFGSRELRAPSAKRDLAAFERLALGDATEVRFRPGTRVDVRERSDSRVVVSVRQGAAHFDVRHDPRRLFRVEVGSVEVEDLGTRFEVENKVNSVRVSVSEGSVAVSFRDARDGTRKRATLKAGEQGVYPSADTEAAGDPSRASEAPAPWASVGAPSGTMQAQAAADWRELARAGKHRQAYALLAPGGFRDVGNDAGDLLLASDVARLSQHPSDAAMLLRKLLAGHERDPRAPSAAFTLGWVLMNDLRRPREAALAFARSEALAPRGNLAEDALARCAEAWHRAGEISRAKTEVARYEKAYPRGRHQATLKRLVTTP
jgi:transmembrane sensor